MIFGGAKPYSADEEYSQSSIFATEGGQKVVLSNETLFFNVSNGEIKRGNDLNKASYYLSGGYTFS